MSTERDDSIVDNNAEITSDVTSDTNVVNTDVHGPNQRDRVVYSSAEKAYDAFADLAVARKRDQRYADAEAEQRIRFAQEEHDQRQRHAEELHSVNLQTLVAANTATTVADAALVDSLVGIIDKLTSLVPPTNTGSSSGK